MLSRQGEILFRVPCRACEAVGAKCASGVGVCSGSASCCCCSCGPLPIWCPADVPFIFLDVSSFFVHVSFSHVVHFCMFFLSCSFFPSSLFFHIFESFLHFPFFLGFPSFHCHALSSHILGFGLHSPNLLLSHLAWSWRYFRCPLWLVVWRRRARFQSCRWTDSSFIEDECPSVAGSIMYAAAILCVWEGEQGIRALQAPA